MVCLRCVAVWSAGRFRARDVCDNDNARKTDRPRAFTSGRSKADSKGQQRDGGMPSMALESLIGLIKGQMHASTASASTPVLASRVPRVFPLSIVVSFLVVALTARRYDLLLLCFSRAGRQLLCRRGQHHDNMPGTGAGMPSLGRRFEQSTATADCSADYLHHVFKEYCLDKSCRLLADQEAGVLSHSREGE